MIEAETRVPSHLIATPCAPHAVDVATLAEGLGVDVAGLPEGHAGDRLAGGGRNELAAPPQPSLLSRFVAQFRRLLIVVLVGAAALSAVIGEAKAEHSVGALQGMLSPRARVRRGGRVTEVAVTDPVAGDWATSSSPLGWTKEAGDLVLADGDFATIVTAVERGRGICDNILSFVRFQLATNMGASSRSSARGCPGCPSRSGRSRCCGST